MLNHRTAIIGHITKHSSSLGKSHQGQPFGRSTDDLPRQGATHQITRSGQASFRWPVSRVPAARSVNVLQLSTGNRLSNWQGKLTESKMSKAKGADRASVLIPPPPLRKRVKRKQQLCPRNHQRAQPQTIKSCIPAPTNQHKLPSRNHQAIMRPCLRPMTKSLSETLGAHRTSTQVSGGVPRKSLHTTHDMSYRNRKPLCHTRTACMLHTRARVPSQACTTSYHHLLPYPTT